MIPVQSWEPHDDTGYQRRYHHAKALGFMESAWPTVDDVNDTLAGLYQDTIHGVVCGVVASGGLGEVIDRTCIDRGYGVRHSYRKRKRQASATPAKIVSLPIVTCEYTPPPVVYAPSPIVRRPIVSEIDSIWQRALNCCQCRVCAFCDGKQALGSSVDGYRCGRHLSRFNTLYEIGCVVQAPTGPILICQHCQAARAAHGTPDSVAQALDARSHAAIVR